MTLDELLQDIDYLEIAAGRVAAGITALPDLDHEKLQLVADGIERAINKILEGVEINVGIEVVVA